MKNYIHAIFPKAKYQTCFAYILRNIAHKVQVADCKPICEGLKTLYRAENKTPVEGSSPGYICRYIATTLSESD